MRTILCLFLFGIAGVLACTDSDKFNARSCSHCGALQMDLIGIIL